MGLLFFLGSSFLKEKTVELVFISGIEQPFNLNIKFNGKELEQKLIEASEILHPRLKLKTNTIKNTLILLNEEKGISEICQFYCFFNKWVTLVFYEKVEGNSDQIEVTVESSYSKYYGW